MVRLGKVVNPGFGKAFTFHGGFNSLILARRKEKEIPGSFIIERSGRYYVLKPKKIRSNQQFTTPWNSFKNLSIGSKFIFSGEIEYPYSGLASGPWIKTGPRTYTHAEKGGKYRVGSINVKVRRVNAKNPKWSPPFSKRKRKRLGVLYQKAFQKFERQKNPRRGVLIYGRVLKIFAQKTSGPYRGQQFVHTFKRGAILVGMPDGSLRITHP